MLTLTLFRHAKSNWDDPGLDDFARPLSERGLTAAPFMAQYAASRGWGPALALCSMAKRTQQTLDLSLPFFDPKPNVCFEDGLYLASASDLFERLRALDTSTDSVMLIGHNPGLQALAMALAGTGDLGDLAALKTKFPTAGMARLTLPAKAWSQVRLRSGHLTAFVTPSFLQLGRASV